MSLVVAAPTGDVIPAKITQQPGGNYQLEYLSKFTGKIPYCCYYIIIFFTIGSIDPIIIIIIIIFFCFCFVLFCFFNPRKNEGGKKIKKSRKRFEVEN